MLELVGTDGTASVHEVVGGTAMMADAERRTCRPLPGSSLTTPKVLDGVNCLEDLTRPLNVPVNYTTSAATLLRHVGKPVPVFPQPSLCRFEGPKFVDNREDGFANQIRPCLNHSTLPLWHGKRVGWPGLDPGQVADFTIDTNIGSDGDQARPRPGICAGSGASQLGWSGFAGGGAVVQGETYGVLDLAFKDLFRVLRGEAE
jgi:hypothetical protein